MVFSQKLKILTLAKKDTMQKHISRGAEWHNFSFIAPSNYEYIGLQKMTAISVKTPYYNIIVHGFQPKSENFDLAEKDTI